MELFKNRGKWYKGNLHTHTTVSDGRRSPEECIGLYRKAGYDFLALTDHRKFGKGFKQDDFLVLSGVELHINDFRGKRAYHIVGIGIEEEIYSDDSFKPQQLIDEINRKKGMAIIAHPAWSLLTHADIMELKGYAGIEIWNTVSETDSMRGDSTSSIDILASKGMPSRIFAVDDTHFYRDDLFGGYIKVNSEELGREAIMKNIWEGNFYCSQGPEIKQIYVDDKKISVETSPVERIAFMSDTFYCGDRVHGRDMPAVTGAEYVIKPTDRVVRIECRDDKNRKAWSQFIRVNA